MQSATSFALPKPTPTRPASSPTTTRAEKLKRRPPLTTFAQRLMCTTFSVNGSSSTGLSLRPPRLLSRPPNGFFLLLNFLKAGFSAIFSTTGAASLAGAAAGISSAVGAASTGATALAGASSEIGFSLLLLVISKSAPNFSRRRIKSRLSRMAE